MSRAGIDLDLLFGLLVLQTGLIDQSRLVSAFRAWIGGESVPFADHLVARGDLNKTQQAEVETLAELQLERHGGDSQKALAAIHAGRSIREGLRGLADPEIDSTLAKVDSDSTEGYGDSDRTAGTTASDGQRFRILRPHAKGGLGEVFVALDQELHREVALKQILEPYADEPVSRSRFLREAVITGGLEHPGIVPVYGLQHDLDGRPFYAMPLVRGESLKDAIKRFHAAEQSDRDPGERALGFRGLLGQFIAVCNAMAYAHSRGVIHRDLKPANILLGPYGETLVVDWGLAKVVGSGVASLDAKESALRPSPPGVASETQPGSVVGTPAYMSPEQAGGHLDQMGPASDVFSLGAILYTILTGHAPFQGESIPEVLLRVQEGRFLPPSARGPSVDMPLESVCLRAMALRPEDRYASPRALANDIETWLASDFERLQVAHQELQSAHNQIAEQNHLLQKLAKLEHQALGAGAIHLVEELKSTHAELNSTQGRLAHTEKLASLGQLVATLSHEINNPLSLVSNNVAGLVRVVPDLLALIGLYRQGEQSLGDAPPELVEKILELCQRIDLDDSVTELPRLIEGTREGLRRIERIVKELRLFARVDEGDWNEVDLNPGIETTINIIKGYARKRGVRIVMDLGALPTIRCRAARIHQVIVNLLTNAIDACAAETGVVTVRTETEAMGVRIGVQDNGCGIAEENRSRIFDPLFTTKPAGQGTGLGLSISYGIVLDHGGRIDVQSTPGQGSCFSVVLPREPPST